MTLSPNRTLAFTLAAAALVSMLPAEAQAGWRANDTHRRPATVERHSDVGDLPAAGMIGLAAGAIIAGIAGQSQPAWREPAWRHPHGYPRPSPDRVYFPPAPPSGKTPPRTGR